MTDCYFDTDDCLVCPEQQLRTGSPSRFDARPVIGWNAGANSISRLDGAVHVVIPMSRGTAGAVIGLKGERTRNTLPVLIEHGWYFASIGAACVAQVMERGSTKTVASAYAENDLFEIRRQGGNVRYFKNGVPAYTSSVPSSGSKVVNACLYASGDRIGTD